MSGHENLRLAHLVRLIVDKSDGSPTPHVDLEDIAQGTGRVLATAFRKQQHETALRFAPGDVLFSKLRPYLAKSFIADRAGSASPELLVMRPSTRIDGDFLLYMTIARPWVEWANRGAFGSKMPRTSWQHMREFTMRLPSLEQQLRVVDFLREQVRTIDALMTKVEDARDRVRARFRVALTDQISEAEAKPRRESGLSWIAHLPAERQVAKITRFAKLGTGHTPSRTRPELWTHPTIPWITTGEVAQIRLDQVEAISETRELISEAGVKASAAVIHPAGTVVLSRTASAGYSAIMGVDMATSQDFVSWTCGPSLRPSYLLWCLRAMRPDLLGRLAQGSTHKTIYFPDVEALKIPIPPVEQQDRIVTGIREAKRLEGETIAAYDQLWALLSERRQALITAVMTGQLDVTTASREVA